MNELLREVFRVKCYSWTNLSKMSDGAVDEAIEEIEVPSVPFENRPMAVLTGLPGSGKSTLVKELSEKYTVESISIDDYFKDLRRSWETNNRSGHPVLDMFLDVHRSELTELILNIVDSKNFTNVGKVDLFKDLEMRLFIYCLVSGEFAGKILDLSGSIMLQPAVVKILSGFNVFNLEIKSSERVCRLMHDYLTKPEKRFKYEVAVNGCIESNWSENQQLFLPIENIKPPIFSAIELKEFIRDKYKEVSKMHNDKSLLLNEFKHRLGDLRFVVDLMSQKMTEIDAKEVHRFRFYRKAKHTVTGIDGITL